MTEKVTELKRGISNVTLSGRIKVNPDQFSIDEVSERSGYKYSRCSFGVECGDGNVVYVQVMGGFFPDKATLTPFDKDGNKLEIAWKDRKEQSVIEQIPNYALYKGGLERDENGRNVVTNMLSEYDMVQYLKDHLVEDMHVVVRGEFKFNEYKDEVQRTINLRSIFLAYPKKYSEAELAEMNLEEGQKPPVRYNEFAEFKQTVLITNNEKIKPTKQDVENGKLVVPVFMADYAKEINGKLWKKQRAFEQQLVLPFATQEELEKKVKIANLLFVTKPNKVRELVVIGNIVEGNDTRQVKKEDIKLAPDVQELVDLGLVTIEQVMSTVTVNSTRLRELRFSSPNFIEDENGRRTLAQDDEKYTLDVVFPPELEDDDEDFDDDVEDETSTDAVESESSSDEAWLKDLGLD